MKHSQFLIIPGRMPGLNDILDGAQATGRQHGRGQRHSGYSGMKQTWRRNIAIYCAQQGIGALPPDVAATFHFTWYEPDRRRDPDNVSSGGRKIVFDGLVHAGILAGDGWQHVRGFTDTFRVDSAQPSVMIEITYEEDE